MKLLSERAMKKYKFFILASCFTFSCVTMAEDTSVPWNEWLSSHATPKIREVTHLSSDGTVQRVVTTTEYDIRIKQVNVVERTLGEDKQLHLSREERNTEVLDAHGGSYVLREQREGISATLVPRQIVEEIRTAKRTETTVRTRDDEDRLVITRRTVREQQDDGSVVTTIFERDSEGNLVVLQRQIDR